MVRSTLKKRLYRRQKVRQIVYMPKKYLHITLYSSTFVLQVGVESAGWGEAVVGTEKEQNAAKD